MSVTISILNQKGGSGKTTLATNISVGLARMGGRVLLVDTDPQVVLAIGDRLMIIAVFQLLVWIDLRLPKI